MRPSDCIPGAYEAHGFGRKTNDRSSHEKSVGTERLRSSCGSRSYQVEVEQREAGRMATGQTVRKRNSPWRRGGRSARCMHIRPLLVRARAIHCRIPILLQRRPVISLGPPQLHHRYAISSIRRLSRRVPFHFAHFWNIRCLLFLIPLHSESLSLEFNRNARTVNVHIRRRPRPPWCALAFRGLIKEHGTTDLRIRAIQRFVARHQTA